jgi:hypothetical protein
MRAPRTASPSTYTADTDSCLAPVDSTVSCPDYPSQKLTSPRPPPTRRREVRRSRPYSRRTRPRSQRMMSCVTSTSVSSCGGAAIGQCAAKGRLQRSGAATGRVSKPRGTSASHSPSSLYAFILFFSPACRRDSPMAQWRVNLASPPLLPPTPTADPASVYRLWLMVTLQHRRAEYLSASIHPVRASEALQTIILALDKAAADGSSSGSNSLTAQAAGHASRYALPRLRVEPHA